VKFAKFISFLAFFSALCVPALGLAQEEDPIFKKIKALDWKSAPAEVRIGDKATIKLDSNLAYLDATNTNQFLTLQGNLPQANTYTVSATDMHWFSIYTFVDEGYVKDDEKIDADALLDTLKENNKASQAERKRRNLPGLLLEGWAIPPRYDPVTKRLEWATMLRSESGEKTVNFSTKVLGRRGHMNVVLVSGPETLEKDIVDFKNSMKNFDYVPGERYSEWTQGDKVAAYGLGALVLGGAAAVATKKGLWAVLGTFFAAAWKLIAGAAVAALAGLKSLFSRKNK